ncbi:MAG TPA: hypothetical protein VKA43_08420 [Gammaproteobacteria bacterium]|nr:hypothetical protein [Gammaproteobacteria bacterium]
MRAFVQRPLALAIVGVAAVFSGQVLAQSESAPDGASAGRAEEPEEITIQGERTLEQYRVELEAAREDLVAAYNEANSSDANDITCRNERATGTRMPQRVCRSNAQSEAEAKASLDFLRALTHSAGGFRSEPGGPVLAGGPQINASIGAAVAQGEGELLSAESRAVIEAELERLKKEDRRVYRAAVKYLELQDEYDRARGATARP